MGNSHAGATSPDPHPFDEAYQVKTAGWIGHRDLRTGTPADAHNADYGASQASIIRKVIGLVPDLDQSTFVDLGCGKGRALVVATEFPFRDILGVELVSSLAQAARANAEVIRSRHPERTPIRVLEGNAAAAALPDGQLVIYMFHPFFGKIMQRVIANIERFVAHNPDNKAFVIYYNPVLGRLFDRSPGFERYAAKVLAYEESELKFQHHPRDRDDTVIIWQTRGTRMAEPHPGASASIRTIAAGWRVTAHPAKL